MKVPHDILSFEKHFSNMVVFDPKNRRQTMIVNEEESVDA